MATDKEAIFTRLLSRSHLRLLVLALKNYNCQRSATYLLRIRLLGAVLAIKDTLAVLVQLELDNLDLKNEKNSINQRYNSINIVFLWYIKYLGGVDGDAHSRTVGLLALDTLDMDAPLAAVHLDDLALLALVVATHNVNLWLFTSCLLHANLVILANRDAANMVLGAQVLAQGRTHDDAANAMGDEKFPP